MSGDGLDRSLGLAAMTAITVNCIVASGIFVLPAQVAAVVGPAWMIVYVICAVAVALVFLALAEGASRVSETGGTYRLVDVAFGPYLGMLMGALLWFGNVSSSAAIAVVFVGTLGEMAPVLHDPVLRAGILIATYTALTYVNIRGTRAGASVVEVVTLAKITPLAILIVGGLWALRSHHVPVWADAPIHDIGRASLVLFFAFTGIEVALAPAGEVTNPSRTIPRAVLLALVIVTALYIGAHYVAQGVLGPSLAADQTAPLAATAKILFGPIGQWLMLIGAALATFAYVSGDILATPRVLFTFGRDGYLPSACGKVHERYRTPHIAIAAYSVIACALALTGTFIYLAVLAAIATLIIYLACCLATIMLRRRDVRTAGAPFLVPGGPIVPVLGSVVIVWLLAQATRQEYVAIAAVIVGASLLYLVREVRVRRQTRDAPEPSA